MTQIHQERAPIRSGIAALEATGCGMVGGEQMVVKNANTDPWYVLMTLYGEQGGSGYEDASRHHYDKNLYDRNRRLWNAWAGLFLMSSNHEKVDTQVNIPESELAGNEIDWREVRDLHRTEMMNRNGLKFHYPGFPAETSPSGKPITLRNLEFDKLVCWDGYYFPMALCVFDSTFKKAVCSAGTVFANGVYLKGVSFLDETSFGSSWFQGVEFEDTDFLGKFSAPGAEFKERAFFSKVRFESARFSMVKFVSKNPRPDFLPLNIKFRDVVFKGIAIFDSSEFGDVTSFYNVVFHERALFVMTKFYYTISFSDSEFRGRVKFNRAQFLLDYSSKQRDEYASIYITDINFNNVDFQAPTSFEDALFANVWPSFESTVLHSDSVFSPKDECWPLVTGKSNSAGHKTCSKIRRNQSSQGFIDGEHFFFRREMDFQLNSCTGGKRLLFLGYGLFSDFGRSIFRPLWSLFILWLVGVFAIAGYLGSCCALSPEEIVQRPWGTAVALSFSNLFPMFGFGRTYLDWVNLPTALEVYSAAQTVFSLPLLFFLWLGLRQQFKIYR